MNTVKSLSRFLIGLFVFSLLFISCRKTIDDPIKFQDFDKELRMKLGDLLHIAITANSDEYPILSNIPPYDTSAYFYLQKLYDQITFEMHLDHQAIETNRWDQSKEWKVTILKIDTLKTIFTIPGGNIYITTGLLKELHEEYEIVYLMAFEASLMNKKILLDHLISKFHLSSLYDAANRSPSTTDALIKKIADYICYSSYDTEYDIEKTKEVDQLTAELICLSSSFDRTGILPLIEQGDIDVHWLSSRSYQDRGNYILNLDVNASEDCGNFKSNGNYQRYVLNRL